MTDLTTTVSEGTSSQEPTHLPTMAPTQLITEQQLQFSTAAAVALPPSRTRGIGDLVQVVAAKVRAAFARSEKRPAKKDYPKRYGWIENAAMSRAMDRL